MAESYDAIVVGAGPSGSTAAYTLAGKGKKTALLERGREPGEKTVYGGTVYSIPMERLHPNFFQEVAIERTVVKEEFWILEEDAAIQLGFTGLKFLAPPYNKCVIRRSNLDPYLAQKARDQGASLYTEALATKILKKKRKVVGVEINGEDEIEAEAVILSEGVQASLAKSQGFHPPHPLGDFSLYGKEVLGLDGEKIEDRFQLEPREGAIIGFIGYPLAEVLGRAALWTERDSLSLIVGAHLDVLIKKRIKIQDLLQRFKEHPLIKRLLRGALPIEYQGHMIPKGGYRAIPELFKDGLLVTGDAATMVSGRRGTDLAMFSGQLAAETLSNALFKGDVSAKELAYYKEKLYDTFFMQDIKADRKKVSFKTKYPESEHLLSVALNEVAYEFFRTGMKAKKEKEKTILNSLKDLQPPLKSLRDMMAMAKYWEAF